MEKLISSKNNIQTIPESYFLPPHTRPGNPVVPFCHNIPVVDLGGKKIHDRATMVQQIMKASQEFGFFQVINHGISEELMEEAIDECGKEFFELPAEDTAELYTEDRNQSCRLYTSIDYDNENVHYWRDCLKQICHPLEENIQFSGLKSQLNTGLELEAGFFDNELIKFQLMYLNHYPPCPDPRLTLGLRKHSDSSVISILQGDVPGLQVLKDEKWLANDPVPGAFVVNIGNILHFISNGKLKSAEHRVVANKKVTRTTITSFIYPSGSCSIEPGRELIKNASPLY